ncbi:hypothetical protein MUK42_31248 [Musa troglodytarum]|uniref:Uncharacterized protein n=1 Tax=Musa troglodytarum TaxID=320322 RepID=A0A9E7K957_9LILI|nr:hypothetical protein MUK42_31248 [Musa troglodytarum]
MKKDGQEREGTNIWRFATRGGNFTYLEAEKAKEKTMVASNEIEAEFRHRARMESTWAQQDALGSPLLS